MDEDDLWDYVILPIMVVISSITYFGLNRLKEEISDYTQSKKLNGFTWLEGFILLMLTGIGSYAIGTARLDFGTALFCLIFGTASYSFYRKLNNERWMHNLWEFLQVLGLFAWSRVIQPKIVGTVLFYYPVSAGNTFLLYKVLITCQFWWPLIDGSITDLGILMRTLLMMVLPLAFSDAKTSQAYQESGAKNCFDESMTHHLISIYIYDVGMDDVIFFSVFAIIVNGMKGTISKIQEQGPVSFFKRLNYWAAFAIVIFCILAEDSLPTNESRIPQEFYNFKRPWFKFFSTDPKPEPLRTPIIYRLLHNYYNFI